jgi:hypothetical protein
MVVCANIWERLGAIEGRFAPYTILTITACYNIVHGSQIDYFSVLRSESVDGGLPICYTGLRDKL